MSTPRSTALAERILVIVCGILFLLFVGYEVGLKVAQMDCKVESKKPVAKKLSVHAMTKQSQRAWAKYLAVRGM